MTGVDSGVLGDEGDELDVLDGNSSICGSPAHPIRNAVIAMVTNVSRFIASPALPNVGAIKRPTADWRKSRKFHGSQAGRLFISKTCRIDRRLKLRLWSDSSYLQITEAGGAG